jgi:hypothetical protein
VASCFGCALCGKGVPARKAHTVTSPSGSTKWWCTDCIMLARRLYRARDAIRHHLANACKLWLGDHRAIMQAAEVAEDERAIKAVEGALP